MSQLFKNSDGFTGHLPVTGKNTIRPIDEFAIETFKLEFRRDTPKVWTVGGGLDVEIFGRTCPLTAKYDGGDEDKRLTITGQMSGDPVPLPGIDDASKAALKNLCFTLELTRKDGKTSYSGGVDGLLTGKAFGENTTVSASLDGEFQLHADAKQLVLADVASAVDIVIPDVVPTITDSQGPAGRRTRDRGNTVPQSSHSFVLVAVKAWQVPETAEFIKPLVGSSTVILPVQNGVEATRQLAAVRGDDRVLAGFCRILSIIVEPRYIRHLGVDPCMVFGKTAGAPPIG